MATSSRARLASRPPRGRVTIALVECDRCGWSQEVDENLPMDAIEPLAIKLYSEHQLEFHPHTALNDGVVREYIELLAAMIASTNGVMGRRPD